MASDFIKKSMLANYDSWKVAQGSMATYSVWIFPINHPNVHKYAILREVFRRQQSAERDNDHSTACQCSAHENVHKAWLMIIVVRYDQLQCALC